MKKIERAFGEAETKITKSCQTDVGKAFKRFIVSAHVPKIGVDLSDTTYIRIITAVSFNIRDTFYGANKLVPF